MLGASAAGEPGMARVHEKTEFSVSVIGCGRMGCAIAGRAPLRSVKGMGGGRPGDYGGEGVCEVGVRVRAKARVKTRVGVRADPGAGAKVRVSGRGHGEDVVR